MVDHARKSDLIDLTVQLHHVTAKAVLVSDDGDKEHAVWLPLSQCEIERKDGGIVIAEDVARRINAHDDLFDGCNALLGLIQLVSDRDDLPSEVRDALTSSHRIDEARAAIAKAGGA